MVAKHLGVDAYEVRHNVQLVSELLGSIRHTDNGTWPQIWTPGAIIDMWRSDKARFAATLKWALDGFVLAHRNAVEDIPVAEKSMGVMDALATTRTTGVPLEVKAHLEYFVDVTVMCAVRSLDDLEPLLAQFRGDSQRTTKLLYVLVAHLFRSEQLLCSLAKAHALLAQCPDGPWKPALQSFAAARSGRGPR